MINQKPDWLVSYENLVGQVENSELSIENSLKSGSLNNLAEEPAWLTTFLNRKL